MTKLMFSVNLLIAFTSVTFIAGEAVVEWFGENLQYKCRCQDDQCTITGQCIPGYSCERGWFGPECQYVDLAATTNYSAESAAHVLTDGSDDTCVTRDTNSVTITLKKVYPFTWMRVYTKSAGACFDVSIQFSPIKPKFCTKIYDPSGFFDVYCDYHGGVSSITLSGRCTHNLCSVHVSGGRNVALRGITSQNGVFPENGVTHGPERSVDGNTHGDFYVGKTCSHTAPRHHSTHWWKVTFNNPIKIYRYVIYNRRISEQAKQHIIGFHVETEDKDGHIIFSHVDNNPVAENVYELMDPNNSQTAVATTLKLLNSKTLNFWEMEMYGDTECHPGFYGRECKQRCNSNCAGDHCLPGTGACPSGCKPGYIGISCLEQVQFTPYPLTEC